MLKLYTIINIFVYVKHIPEYYKTAAIYFVMKKHTFTVKKSAA